MIIGNGEFEDEIISLPNGKTAEIIHYLNYSNRKSYVFYSKQEKCGYVKFSEDWSKTPGGKEDGLSCFNIIIKPELERISKLRDFKFGKVKFIFDFDDCLGFPSTFIEEIFGKQLMKYYKHISVAIIANDDAYIFDDIVSLIKEKSQCDYSH